MITADQLVAHLVGDYLLQSDWMAQEKTKRWTVALVHALAYSVPFLLMRPSFAAWAVLVLTHAAIDRYRLARFVVYAKNFLAPRADESAPAPLFWFLWDELSQGALGAVVLADTRRLEDCFPAVDYFEHRRIPFVVAVNCFAGARNYGAHEVSQALDLDRGTPVVLCDARDRDSGKEVLIRLVEYAGRMHTARLLDSVG